MFVKYWFDSMRGIEKLRFWFKLFYLNTAEFFLGRLLIFQGKHIGVWDKNLMGLTWFRSPLTWFRSPLALLTYYQRRK